MKKLRFFLVYLLIIQMLHKTLFKKYLEKIARVFQHITNNFNEIINLSKLFETFFPPSTIIKPLSYVGKKRSVKRTKKYKILYLYIYPYFNIIWQLGLSKIMVRIKLYLYRCLYSKYSLAFQVTP